MNIYHKKTPESPEFLSLKDIEKLLFHRFIFRHFIVIPQL